MKAKVDKLDINELVKVPTAVNDLKTTLEKLDVGKLKAVPKDLKKVNDVVNE